VGSTAAVGTAGSVGRLSVGMGFGSGVGGIGVGTMATAVWVWAAWSVATIWVVSTSTVRATSVRMLSRGSVGVAVLGWGWQAPIRSAANNVSSKDVCAFIGSSLRGGVASMTPKKQQTDWSAVLVTKD